MTPRALAAVCGILVGAGVAPAAAAAPIPEDADDVAAAQKFIGGPATPGRVPAPRVPRHPFMAPNGLSNVHDDGYQTDTYTWSGPLGRQIDVTSQFFGTLGICGITITFDRHGRLVTICISGTAVQLRLLHPLTLETLATHDLPPRTIPPGSNPFTSTGGAYFYLDHRDRAVVSLARHIYVVGQSGGETNPRFVRLEDHDLTSVIPADDQLISALADWKGDLWFVTREHGIVGVLDRRTGRLLGQRRLNEPIANSLAVGDDGGVYIVTARAMYRFDSTRRGRPRVSWRVRYRNSGIVKPGQFDAGSGTTPTLMGREYVSITDNADPMNVVVYRRARRLRRGQRRVVCEHPVFDRGASATENSLNATGRSIIVENNYGYDPPPAATSEGKTTTPGFERIDVERGGRGCRRVWRNRQEIAPSVVPKTSLANGLVYAITKPAGLPDRWYLTALSFRTGRRVYSALAGTGLFFNNHYAGIAISPRRVLYVGVLGGTIRIADGGR
jgi:hypothetical protein